MSAKSDQVFQLSLTEIAFMIAFILMFLLGFLVYKTTQESKSLSEMLAAVEGVEQKTADLKNATHVLAEAVAANTSMNPDEVISKLIAESAPKAEVERLERLLEEQDKQITALAEIQKAVDQFPADRQDEKIREEVQASLLLASEVRKQAEEALQASGQAEGQSDPSSIAEKAAESIRELGKIEKLLAPREGSEATPGEPGEKASDRVAELVKQAQEHAALMTNGKSPEAVKKENADLRGQIAFLHNKLNAKGGMDYPPCWADEQTGKIQMLFSVELREHDLSVAKAWPAVREADAMALPGIHAVLAKPVTTYAEFIRDTQAIADLSRSLNCRHYVRLKSTIADAVQSDRRRLTIEDSFYKFEVRR
ncbi:MAG: hypothetical protein NDI70_01605 [Pseudomonas sagittaria]|nr:hypothetical protein [Pseudomonas sagittaria]